MAVDGGQLRQLNLKPLTRSLDHNLSELRRSFATQSGKRQSAVFQLGNKWRERGVHSASTVFKSFQIRAPQGTNWETTEHMTSTQTVFLCTFFAKFKLNVRSCLSFPRLPEWCHSSFKVFHSCVMHVGNFVQQHCSQRSGSFCPSCSHL